MRQAIDWEQRIYVVSADFPEIERFALQAQVHRATVSVASNIAEGAVRETGAAFARLMELVSGALMESMCKARMVRNLGYIKTR